MSVPMPERNFQDLFRLLADWHWEQDEHYRFLSVVETATGKSSVDPQILINKTLWECNRVTHPDDQWSRFKAILKTHQPFHEFVFRYLNAHGELRYISSTGYPIFDNHAVFRGYRGVAKDVTNEMWKELRQRLEHAITNILIVSYGIDDAIPQILRTFCETAKWAGGRFWHWNETAKSLSRTELYSPTSSSEIRDFLLAGEPIQLADHASLTGRVAIEKKPIWISNLNEVTDAVGIERANSCGLQGVFAFPIKANGQLIGVMEFVLRDGYRPVDILFESIEYIGDQIGQFCRRIQWEELLRDTATRFESLVKVSSDWYWEQDEYYRFIQPVGGGLHTTGLELNNAIGKTRWELPYFDTDEKDWEDHRAVLDARKPFQNFRLKLYDENGELHHLSVSGCAVFDDNGNFSGYRGVGADITEQIKANEALKESEARFRDLVDLSAEWYWEQDENHRFTFRSGVFQGDAVSINLNEIVGLARWEQPGVNAADNKWAEHKAMLDAHQSFYDFIYERSGSDGKPRFIATSGRPVFDDQQKFIGYRGVGRDITERLLADQHIQFLAYHDGLTSLPNRVMFNEMLNHALNRARRYNRKVAILFLDLDRFKMINDTLGHEAGDNLLKEVSERLKICLRKSDVVARLGGDEFVILLEEIPDIAHASKVAEKILHTVIKPFTLLNQEFRVTVSIGISVYPEDGDDGQTLLKNADIALYRAKEEGKNNYQLYSEKMNAFSFQRLALETALRRALERNEFLLHYQAKIDLQTNQVTGVEALIRWQHPDLGMVSPAQFIPIAEETGLIIPIGKWVLQAACRQNKIWQQEGLPPLRMAVNLSARQFAADDLVKDVASILQETELSAEYLELEITESMVMRDPEKAVSLLTALKEMGIRLAIDDFGVGYSSLATIKRFPIDTIKVDRTFIRDIPTDTEDKALTEAIIAMGKTLSLTVIAEGVETQQQYDFLREKSCDEFQGFYFNKPVDKDKFTELLRSHQKS